MLINQIQRGDKMVKYCPKCGAKNDDDGEFCNECGSNMVGNPNKSNDSISISKKTLLIGAVVIIIIAIIGIFALTGGNVQNIQYVGVNTISIDSVSELGTEQVNPTEYSDYSGVTKGYTIVYSAQSDLENVSIETQAYDKNGEHLDAMANWMGFNPLNVLCYNKTLTSGSSYTANVLFGTQNATDFDVSKFEVYVYQTTPEETKLIDKFDYNMNQ